VAEDGSLANVVVYIRDKKVKVHEDYEASAEEPAVLDNEQCRFEPHVLAIRTTQPLTVKNSDTVAHNTKVDTFVNAQINPLIPAGEAQSFDFSQEENVPSPVGCNIHPWMRAYVLVRSNPYFAVSAKDGTFAIKNIPTGEREFQFWHETAGYLGGIKLGGQESDRKGRAELAIKPGTNDLGDIKIDESKFKK
jgi:hypothetical protein